MARKKRTPPSDPQFLGSSASRIPTEGQPISNAKLAADLQAFALAVRLVGLEGLRDGTITFNGEQPKC